MKKWEIHARTIMRDFCFPMEKINMVINYAKELPELSNEDKLNRACRKARELL